MPDAAGRQGLKPLSATCPCYRCRLLLGFAYADRDSKDRDVSASCPAKSRSGRFDGSEMSIDSLG